MLAHSKLVTTHALLKGSTVKLSVCSRYEGASFIVVKGLKDARKCAWMGELGQYKRLKSRFLPTGCLIPVVYSKGYVYSRV